MFRTLWSVGQGHEDGEEGELMSDKVHRKEGPIVTIKVYCGELKKTKSPKDFAVIMRAIKRLIIVLGEKRT